MGKKWKQWETIFLGSKITVDGDCSWEIKRGLLLRRKAVTDLDSILKSRDITESTKAYSQSYRSSRSHGCESWTIKRAECWRTNAFELWCWRRLLRVPWIARRSNQSILKEIIEYSGTEAEAPILWPPDGKSQLFGKNNDAGKDWGRRRRGRRDEFIRWHHRLNGH